MGLCAARHRYDGPANLLKERRRRTPSRDQITSGTSIARRSTGSIPTLRSPHGSRAPRRTNTSVCWDRSCARRSAIRSRSFSRTTPRGPTACIRMESSTRRPRRGPCTPTMFPTRKRPGPWCRPGRRSLTSGKCRNGRGLGRRIPARSSGCTTRTSTNIKMSLLGWWGPSS